MPKQEDEPAPKKDATKRRTRPDLEAAADPEKPKTKRVEKPGAEKAGDDAKPKKTSATGPALKKDADAPAAEKPAGEKVKTKRVSKDAAPAADAAPTTPEGDAPKGSKTGKRSRPAGDDASGDKPEKPEGKKGDSAAKKKRPGGERPKVAAPAPATRGPIDYAFAALGPLVGLGGGLFAFLLLSKGFDHAASPVLGYTNPADVAQILMMPFVAGFKFLPIVVGLVVGLLVTFESLKMAPGTATRIMAFLTLCFTFLATAPFILDARNLNQKLATDVAQTYKWPRGQDADPRALELKISPDEFALRQLKATFKYDLDEGEIPAPWVATMIDMVPDPKADEKAGEKEGKIHFADLRIALGSCRDLQAKHKADVDPILAKLEALRDKASDLVTVPDEETQKLEDGWNKFQGRLLRDLSKPQKPKGAGEWFTRFDTKGDHGEKEPSKADLPFGQKIYLGKLVHSLVKDLPAEMRYAGALQVEVPLDYVPKNDAEKLLTKYDFVYVCYDLEKPDREPVLIPQLKGILGEGHFKVEVLGEK